MLGPRQLSASRAKIVFWSLSSSVILDDCRCQRVDIWTDDLVAGWAGCWGGSVPVPLTGEGDGAQNKLPGGCQRAPDRTQPAQACQHQQHLNYDTFTIYNSHSLKPEMTRRRALAASDHLTQREASDLQLSGTLHPALWLRNMDLKQDPGCKNRRL